MERLKTSWFLLKSSIKRSVDPRNSPVFMFECEELEDAMVNNGEATVVGKWSESTSQKMMAVRSGLSPEKSYHMAYSPAEHQAFVENIRNHSRRSLSLPELKIAAIRTKK
jgi:hypothetical protein